MMRLFSPNMCKIELVSYMMWLFGPIMCKIELVSHDVVIWSQNMQILWQIKVISVLFYQSYDTLLQIKQPFVNILSSLLKTLSYTISCLTVQLYIKISTGVYPSRQKIWWGCISNRTSRNHAEIAWFIRLKELKKKWKLPQHHSLKYFYDIPDLSC